MRKRVPELAVGIKIPPFAWQPSYLEMPHKGRAPICGSGMRRAHCRVMRFVRRTTPRPAGTGPFRAVHAHSYSACMWNIIVPLIQKSKGEPPGGSPLPDTGGLPPADGAGEGQSLHRNGFGQIAGLVDITPAHEGHIVGKQLQGHHIQRGQQHGVAVGHQDGGVYRFLHLFPQRLDG